MSKNKRKLIWLLYVWVALGVLHFLGIYIESAFNLDGISFYFSLPVQAYGILMAWYIVTYRCPNPACRRNQIVRSVVPPIHSWPESVCYHCGTPLNARYKNGRPIEP